MFTRSQTANCREGGVVRVFDATLFTKCNITVIMEKTALSNSLPGKAMPLHMRRNSRIKNCKPSASFYGAPSGSWCFSVVHSYA